MVIGWSAVPLFKILIFVVGAYVPPRTAITSPGWARSTARWIVFSGLSIVPAAPSLPFVATTSVVAAAAGGADTAASPASAVPPADVTSAAEIARTVLFSIAEHLTVGKRFPEKVGDTSAP